MLPVVPPGGGDSPYDSPSSFAGSPELVSLRLPGRRRPARHRRLWPRRLGCVTACAHVTGPPSAFARAACARPSSASKPGSRGTAWKSCASASAFGCPTTRCSRRSRASTRASRWFHWPAELRRREPAALRAARARPGWRDRLPRVRAAAVRSAMAAAARPRPAPRRAAARRHSDVRGARRRRRLAAPRICFCSTSRANGAAWPVCRPTTSAPTASAGATRCTTGRACARPATLGGSSGCAATCAASTPSGSITSSASIATGRSRRARPARARGASSRCRVTTFSAGSRGARASCRSSPKTWASSRPRSRRCATPSGCRACACWRSPSPTAREAYLPHRFHRALRRVHGHPRQRHHASAFWTRASAQPDQHEREQLDRQRERALAYSGSDGREPHWDLIRSALGFGRQHRHFPDPGRARFGHGSPHERARNARTEIGAIGSQAELLSSKVAAKLARLTETYERLPSEPSSRP